MAWEVGAGGEFSSSGPGLGAGTVFNLGVEDFSFELVGYQSACALNGQQGLIMSGAKTRITEPKNRPSDATS